MIKTFTQGIGKLAILEVKISNELWYTTLTNGEKRKMLFDISHVTRADIPGVAAIAIILPFLSIHIAY